VLKQFGAKVKGLAHITGGGLLDNVPRILQPGLQATLRRDAWQMPKLFTWLQQQGGVADTEMYRVFNCGIGMVVVVSADDATAISQALVAQGETVYALGVIQGCQATDAQTVVI
jgi:phosphoribosylformylglycinamidine cyclo-ligase